MKLSSKFQNEFWGEVILVLPSKEKLCQVSHSPAREKSISLREFPDSHSSYRTDSKVWSPVAIPYL